MYIYLSKLEWCSCIKIMTQYQIFINDQEAVIYQQNYTISSLAVH